MTRKQLPECVEPMENKAIAFYMMTMAETMFGVSSGWASDFVPGPVQEKIEWLMSYFRAQVPDEFVIAEKDWNVN